MRGSLGPPAPQPELSRQCDARAAVIPTARDTDSRSSPRNRRITTSRLRPAENRPPRPRPAATPVATDSSTCFLISTLLLRELSRNQVSKKTLGRRSFEALEPIRQGIRERFGGIGEGVARGLRLRHDHGSNYLADDFQQEVAFFGIESSPSFVREPEGNGVAERFIRTLKENLLWVRSFETIEELRLALLEFKRTYNELWMLEKCDYRSPAQVRRDLLGLDAAA